MSTERTYLSQLRFSILVISFALGLTKIEWVAKMMNKGDIAEFLRTGAGALAVIATLVAAVGLFSFYKTMSYLKCGEQVDAKEVVDPRIYMAAERTFLAWIRTAIAITVFGFVIEKFEFFLVQLDRILHISTRVHHEKLFSIGAFIIGIGVLTLVLGTANFYRTISQIDRGFYRTNVWLYKAYGLVIFITCLTLAFYILELI